MKDEQILTALTAKAISIRINGGSKEARYLAAYHSLSVLPAFIIVNDGQLVVDIHAGESKNEFKAAILRALSSGSSQPPMITSQTPNTYSSTTLQPSNYSVARPSALATTSSSAQASLDQSEPSRSNAYPGPAASTPPLCPSTSRSSDLDASSPTANNIDDHANMPSLRSLDVIPTADIPSNPIHSTATSSDSHGDQPSQTVQNLLADRRRKLEMDKKEKDAAEKTERRAKAEARKEAIVVAPDSAKAKQASYAVQQRKRQQEAKLERERVLRQIEHDKSERKTKEERRKAIAKADAEGTDGVGRLVDQQLASELNPPSSKKSGECAVQVRLFDGSTIRGRFPSYQTLRGNVRPWIDQTKSADIPYTFKQILTPMPNRTLTISEEEVSLQSLGFSPSATLVIIPVQGYAVAYSGGQGIVSKGATAGYNAICAGAGIITRAFGTFLGLGRTTALGELPNTHDATMQGNAEEDTAGTGLGATIRTLRDQRSYQDDQQLYNGNQVPSHALLSIHLKWH